VLNGGAGAVPTLPYTVRASVEGLRACVPGHLGMQSSSTYIIAPWADQLRLGSIEPLAPHVVESFDDLSVTLRWASATATTTTASSATATATTSSSATATATATAVSLKAPLVRGMPYVSAVYDGLTPTVTFGGGLLRLNGQAVPTTSTGARFIATLGGGDEWRVYASPPLTLTATADGRLVASAAYAGVLRAALVPTASAAAPLDAYSSRLPIGGRASAYAAGDSAEIHLEWQATGGGQLLTMALPHQIDSMRLDGGSGGAAATAASTARNLTYPSLKGGMVAVIGEAWVLAETLTRIGFGAPRSVDPAKRSAVVAALHADRDTPISAATDPYWAGKALARHARLMLMADEMAEGDLAAAYESQLVRALEPWLDGRNADPLLHDSVWGGVVFSSGIANEHAGYGAGYYNDQHFQYGYLLFAAAALSQRNASWWSRWREPCLHLVRAIANPSAADPLYTPMRYLDWYDGHSWASGLFPSSAGRNQESTSEAANAWYAIYLLGLAAGDSRVRDLGRILLASEVRATHRYWHIHGAPDADDIYPPPFSADNRVVGIVWASKADYGTWFGSNAEYIYGIQMLPITPAVELLLPARWVGRALRHAAFADALFGRSGAADGWRSILIGAYGLVNQSDAWELATHLTGFDSGNSRANLLYWLATRGVSSDDGGAPPLIQMAPEMPLPLARSPPPSPSLQPPLLLSPSFSLPSPAPPIASPLLPSPSPLTPSPPLPSPSLPSSTPLTPPPSLPSQTPTTPSPSLPHSPSPLQLTPSPPRPSPSPPSPSPLAQPTPSPSQPPSSPLTPSPSMPRPPPLSPLTPSPSPPPPSSPKSPQPSPPQPPSSSPPQPPSLSPPQPPSPSPIITLSAHHPSPPSPPLAPWSPPASPIKPSSPVSPTVSNGSLPAPAVLFDAHQSSAMLADSSAAAPLSAHVVGFLYGLGSALVLFCVGSQLLRRLCVRLQAKPSSSGIKIGAQVSISDVVVETSHTTAGADTSTRCVRVGDTASAGVYNVTAVASERV